VRRHDPAAFTELYARHVDAVYAWLRTRIDWGTTDMTTETLARAWLPRVRYRDERDGLPLPLLLGIAANLLVDAVRDDPIETRGRDRLGLPVDPNSGNSGSRAVSSTPQPTQQPIPLKWIQVSCPAPPPGAGNSGQLRQQRLE
jgi:DNA-directed RNA polymerase specialized sigma24 family protein